MQGDQINHLALLLVAFVSGLRGLQLRHVSNGSQSQSLKSEHWKRNTFALLSVILSESRTKWHSLKLIEEIQPSTQSIHLCALAVQHSDPSFHIQVHRTSVIPWPNHFHHQTTHLPYKVIEMAMEAPSGMAELQLFIVANLLTMAHVLMHLATLGTSGPGNAAKGFFCDYICRCILISIQDPRRPVS